MENKVKNYLSTVRIGEAQSFHNLALFPFQAARNGQVAGLDPISRPEVYSRMHEKFVRSYALEGLMEKEVQPEDLLRALDKAQTFLGDIARAGESKFQSAG